jgi:hypothetical protein
LLNIDECVVLFVDQDVDSIHLGDRPESVVLSLLCSGRVEDAAEVAEKGNMFRLAMLLCQAGSDDELRFMLHQQVQLWEDHEANELMPEDLLAIYKILGTRFTLSLFSLSSNVSLSLSLSLFYTLSVWL